MAVELVTGYAGKAHVSSSEDGARQAGTVGTGMYALETVDEPLKATLENANTVTVGPGDVLINGRHVQLTGSTIYGIPVGTQGQRTSNLLVIRYEVAEDGTESATALTLTGSPSMSEPEDPALATGDILAGDSPVDMPLYRVITTGIETAEPVALFRTIPPIASLPGVFGNVIAVENGGTGQSSLQATRSAMGLGNTLGALPVANGGTGSADATNGFTTLSNRGRGSGDFNSLTSPGYYYIESPENMANRPSTTNWGVLHVVRSGERYAQMYFGDSSSSCYLRTSNGSTWGAWRQIDPLGMYPVGAVYISWSSTSPASLFGGTWAAITGRFPYFNAGTGTGGSNSHTLTVNEMPSHQHSNAAIAENSIRNGSTSYLTYNTNDRNYISLNTGATGGNVAFSTMPSYQTLYAWRRTG